MLALLLSACYTPLNNSGVATTKPWLEVSGKKLDFDGKQYDSCYQFNVRFWPQEAAEQLDLRAACISSCCWRSDGETVTLDFNKNFDKNLAYYGRARKYTPGKITLSVKHSNLLNTTKVSVSPKGSIENNGLIKLSYKEYENPTRLAQIEAAARQLQTRRNAYLNERAQAAQATARAAQTAAKGATQKTAPTKSAQKVVVPTSATQAKALVLQQAGAKIDAYFYHMDKTYKKQGAVFMLSDRILSAQTLSTGEQVVACHARARTGVDSAHLNASTFSCGTWHVNLAAQTVEPADGKSRQIWQGSAK